MNVLVIGGSGLIGSRVVARLRAAGHVATPASPSRGVNAVTGEGLSSAMQGQDVVVDVSNSPTFEEQAALAFFEASGKNLQAAEKAAGVRHHVALSVVGTERLLAMGYFKAKLSQENHLQSAGVPFTIVRATQFFEFVGAIADSATQGQAVHLPPALMQPMAADDVAAAVADIATGEPVQGMVEIAGPEKIPMDELARRYLSFQQDSRTVITDPQATYFGIAVDDQSLTPTGQARLGTLTFAEWLTRCGAPTGVH